MLLSNSKLTLFLKNVLSGIVTSTITFTDLCKWLQIPFSEMIEHYAGYILVLTMINLKIHGI